MIASAALTLWAAWLAAQAPAANPADALIAVLVWGADSPIDQNAFAPEVRIEIDGHLQRSKAYRPRGPRPAKPGLDQMVYEARARYERKLAAVSSDPQAPALAAAYVDSLRPCYEWEGYHDCPEREAVFASEYQRTYTAGPFSEYLPLLAAHRWICAAEAYDYEKRPEDAFRSRREFEQAVSTARRSKALLIRLAAERLARRKSCRAPQ